MHTVDERNNSKLGKFIEVEGQRRNGRLGKLSYSLIFLKRECQ